MDLQENNENKVVGTIDRREGVFNIFKEFYGEDYVDLQDNDILVYFPEVTVTNEKGRSVVIYKVFIKTPITNDGRLYSSFTITRTEYPENQWLSGYMFSHCHLINKNNYGFDRPCLGQGPISSTISSLILDYDEDLWKLYCLELKKYIETESIAGVPYFYLEQISGNVQCTNINNTDIFFDLPFYIKSTLRDINFAQFLLYYIQCRELKFSTYNNKYVVGQSFEDYVINISNAFIFWFNHERTREDYNFTYTYLLNNNIIAKAIKKNGVLHTKHKSINSTIIENKTVLTFKGVKYKLTINKELKSEEYEYNILNPIIVSWLINAMLNSLNYRYENNGTCKNVKYL